MARAKPGPGTTTKTQRIAGELARIVDAGARVPFETVDFAQPARPKTCLEIDFPIVPVNSVASIEASSGAATKPTYQMSKWWARRQSSVFRSLLLAATARAPKDELEAARSTWTAYYGNHQANESLRDLVVADIFMGGGTAVVEASRLGMKVLGNDLNPVAWFVVQNQLSTITPERAEALVQHVTASVRNQLMPMYACDCPRGHRGEWRRHRDSGGEVLNVDLSTLNSEQWSQYSYQGPELVFEFHAKHGLCLALGCGHRTPILGSPVVAKKTLSVSAWAHVCLSCKRPFEIESRDARLAPNAVFVVSATEKPFAVLSEKHSVTCPHCGASEGPVKPRGPEQKKSVEATVLVHPRWLAGEQSRDAADGAVLGGGAHDAPEASLRWHALRRHAARLIEVRGTLPETFVCPETGAQVHTGVGTVPGKSQFACGACGKAQDILEAVASSGRPPAYAEYAEQIYCPTCDSHGDPSGGRFFVEPRGGGLSLAIAEWSRRSAEDLAQWFPRQAVPEGLKTSYQRIPEHGYPWFVDMFNPRQLLAHSTILKTIECMSGVSNSDKDYLLGAAQQYLRYNCVFTIWHLQNNQISAFLSNNNYTVRHAYVETAIAPPVGDGSWRSAAKSLVAAAEWRKDPYELVSLSNVRHAGSAELRSVKSQSQKVYPADAVLPANVTLTNGSSTALPYADSTVDLVITDPPFGNNIQYAELADYFYVWLRLALAHRYPDKFGAEYSPKSLEAVSNHVREKSEPDALYQRLLGGCWLEAARILKPAGILAFTFHHSEDAPWVAVLESLFRAGFYLEATYPIRSDQTKGEGAKPGTFGSQKIEYDIIHVCRKRTEEPTPVSWAKMRRQVLQDVRALKHMLEHHQKAGLPEADLQVIRRGKALEYFSRHYGKVFVDEGSPMRVIDALVGINQLLDEETGGVKDPPPVNAEPFTRQFLRLFDGVNEIPRDQIQKFLRGTGIAPSDFEARGWCSEDKKTFHLTSPLDIARAWQGKHRRGMTTDYDQAAFLIGACFENSGIDANDTLTNGNFKRHPALHALLEWLTTRGATSEIRHAASRAQTILRSYVAKQEPKQQMALSFFEDQGAA